MVARAELHSAVFSGAQANTVPLNPLNPNPYTAEKLDLSFQISLGQERIIPRLFSAVTH